MDGTFYDRAREDQGEIYDFLIALVRTKGVEIKHRLKAAGMILDRGAPAVKRFEMRHMGRVEFTYNSPQLAAAHVLDEASEKPPLPAEFTEDGDFTVG